MSYAESQYRCQGLKGACRKKEFVEVCGAEILGDYFASLSLHKLFYREIESRNFGLWKFVEAI